MWKYNIPNLSNFIVDDNYKCCKEFLSITLDDAIEIEKNTVRQFDSQEWIDQRKKKLTASNFAKVVKRKKVVNEKFLKSIFDPKQFTSAATSYGIANEVKTKEKYTDKFTSKHLQDCGLVVNPSFCFLGATPDGKVCSDSETGMIEIKCPYFARDMKIEEAILTPNFCLMKVGDNYVMNKSHDYYCQVQGQLLVTGAPYCEFIVNTKEDCCFKSISRQRFSKENV